MTSINSARPTSNSALSLPSMLRLLPTRLLLTGALFSALPASADSSAQAQPSAQRPSTLPSTVPTSTPSQPSPTPADAPRPVPQVHADITYGAGQLTVKATDASLNQILREISRQTGMKITGGVTDERVFGSYGPASPAKVLSALLDGTSSNMLLIQSTVDHGDGIPVELVLTPRHGGPTPPNPNAPSFDQGFDASRSEPVIRNAPPVINAPVPPAPPTAAGDTNQPTQPSATNPANGSQPQSPNDVKTPQQIYEQLLRLRQQPTTPTPSANQ